MKVLFSERAMSSIYSEMQANINVETGGVFLGEIVDGDFYVLESVSPGPNSIHNSNSFEYDSAYLNYTINKLLGIYEENVEVVGIWHQHLSGSSTFSIHDDIMNFKFADISRNGIISAIMNPDAFFSIKMYYVNKNHEYSIIDYKVNMSFPKYIGRYRKRL